MNTDYLGDALDYWKGAVLGGLQRQRCLCNLAVDAMLTDPDQWKEAHWQIYARLLHVENEQVNRPTDDLGKREPYFTDLKSRIIGCDAFLDPDTGIYTGNGHGGRKYLYPRNVGTLLNGSNIVLVYQHGARQKMCERIEEIVNRVRQFCGNVDCLSYQASQTAMLFFSWSSPRLDEIKTYFNSLLECCTDSRVVRHHLKTS